MQLILQVAEAFWLELLQPYANWLVQDILQVSFLRDAGRAMLMSSNCTCTSIEEGGSRPSRASCTSFLPEILTITLAVEEQSKEGKGCQKREKCLRLTILQLESRRSTANQGRAIRKKRSLRSWYMGVQGAIRSRQRLSSMKQDGEQI